MLNPIPIQWLALLAYAILRLFVGGILLFLGYRHLAHAAELKSVLKLPFWPFGTLSVYLLVLTEITLAAAFIVGFYTQIAALVLALMCIELIIFRGYWQHPALPSRMFYTLLLGVALSLFITGAGALAFDLPI